MTAYHGGKQKVGKKIAYIIHEMTKDLKVSGYCEPFCGMLGVYQHIPDYIEKKYSDDFDYLAGDTNEDVIKMWSAAQKGWKPPIKDFSRLDFEKLRNSKSSPLRGFIGHQCSFSGIFFSSFQPQRSTKEKIHNISTKITNIAKKLNNVTFSHGDYTQYSNLEGYIIYCDPPYQDTACQYKYGVNHKDFQKWCLKMAKKNYVFISGYDMPSSFKLIASFENNVSYKGRMNNKDENLYYV